MQVLLRRIRSWIVRLPELGGGSVVGHHGTRPGLDGQRRVVGGNERTSAVAGFLRMELAGLEPATSWVRCGMPAT
jgi:hypothetical protein